MKNNYKNVFNYLFFLGLFFFSFNHIEVMPFMGEYIKESGAIFFFLGFFLLVIEIIKTGKINFPINDKLYFLILIFYSICIICTVINFNSVSNNYFKRTTGVSRFIRQIISLSIPFFVFIPFFWRVIQNWTITKIFFTIRRIFLFSLLFASFYGFFEILYSYFGIYPARYVTDLLGNIIPFIKPYYHQGGRISVFAYEPPFFAIYLITISGWMFSYILTENNIIKKLYPSIAVLGFTFFSGSRTGLLVIFFIFTLFIFYLYKNNFYRKQLNILFFGFFIIIFSSLAFNAEKLIYSINQKVESLNFVGNLKTDVSNKTRFGMQYASIQVFKENPIFGVGFGQQVYHSRFHYPRWSTINNWEFKEFYNNKKDPSFPPGYNIYTRLLAELGIVGFLSWMSILLYSLFLCYKFLQSKDFHTKVLAISITISLIGLYINWLQIDTFRLYGVWLNFVILMFLQHKVYQKNE
ncbi:O-antigen ligase family protein [Empedobacter sp. GD03861]|uniref:O-antigen ligase family protein n=1 Tax=Empedobacter sp. GD03861 TaxID=2975390 RepID=UPI00244A9EAE|nr:O-antigen ligase family protein [Empedobacter sp. GD03861]MDH0673356.1 O-antigen ligase family protein [Empedobacter sp. GD03861]